MSAGLEFVFWALLLLGVVLWNTLQGILRKRRRLGERLPAEVPEARQPVPPPVAQPWGRAPGPGPAAAPPEPWGRSPVVLETPAVPLEVGEHAREVAARAVRERREGLVRSRPKRWRTRAEVRRAFVDVVLLGPPRALDPWTGGQEADGRRTTGR